MAAKIPMILDCDPGVDDAIAIMMALSQPSVDLLAITCVAGNANIDCVQRNALRVLRVCDRTDVPVYRGLGKSLLNLQKVSAAHVHSSDGLGGVADPDPPSLDQVQPEHAVHAMIRLSRERPGQLTLVAVGPLSNVAMAIRLDPDFTGRLKKLVIMGGNTEGSGSISDAVEFNFYVDPEAAHIVLSEVQCPTVVVGWETCLKNGLSWEWFKKWTSKRSPKADFARDILRSFCERMVHMKKAPHFLVCDGLAMGVAMDPSMVMESVHCPVHVELQGAATRGQMVSLVINFQGLKEGPTVEIVKTCNTDILAAMFEKATD